MQEIPFASSAGMAAASHAEEMPATTPPLPNVTAEQQRQAQLKFVAATSAVTCRHVTSWFLKRLVESLRLKARVLSRRLELLPTSQPVLRADSDAPASENRFQARDV